VVAKRVAVGLLASVVLALGVAIIPVHITPGGAGAIRCGRSLLPGQFEPDDAEGLGHFCRRAAVTRAAETTAAVAGVLLIGVVPRGRRWWLAIPIGVILLMGGLVGILGNAVD
jgi:hypothetical protein